MKILARIKNTVFKNVTKGKKKKKKGENLLQHLFLPILRKKIIWVILWNKNGFTSKEIFEEAGVIK